MKSNNTISKVVWREPEVASRGRKSANGKRSRIAQFEEALRGNPEQWALVSETQKPTTINPRFRGKDFQRAYRTVERGATKKYRIYARFVGGVK